MAGPSLPTRFQKLWVATAVSNFGDGVRVTAMPLLALSITTDPRAIAGVAVADRVPWLVFILPGGLVADRMDRLRLRILLDTLRCGQNFTPTDAFSSGSDRSVRACYGNSTDKLCLSLTGFGKIAQFV